MCHDDKLKRLSKELRELRKKLVKSHPQPEFGEPCDLCGKPVHKNWQLDHCHETGKFRGWLCNGCNTGLGGIGDSFESGFFNDDNPYGGSLVCWEDGESENNACSTP